MKYTDRFYIISFLLLGIIYIRGLFIPLMNNDSAHHANIALHMYLTGDYVSLIDQGRDYLDKPHLLFWIVAYSYHIFGVNTFAYKFPSLLFTLLGVYSTFRLGGLLYNKRVGKLAALILSSSLAFILANNDVRMDAILTACIVFSSWQLVEYIKFQRWSNILYASLGLAMGFSTKGMVGAAVPLLTILGFMMHQRKLVIFSDFKWMAIPLLFFLLISPVLYSYYQQFDVHPEKEIRGNSGVSGVGFILWSQNVERLEGENFGGKSATRDHFFFLHTLLWAFLPWSFLLIAGLWASLNDHIKNHFYPTSRFDGLTLFTVITLMLILSFSGYKLPHYLNILFPFFAIMTSAYILAEQTEKNGKLVFKVQAVVAALMALVALILNGWSLEMNRVALFICVLMLAVAGFVAVINFESVIGKIIAVSLVGALFGNCLLNFNWYPKLLKYQAGNILAEESKNQIGQDYVFVEGGERSPSFEFYRGELISSESIENIVRNAGSVNVYTGPKGLRALQENGVRFNIIATASDCSVSKLDRAFFDPASRPRVLLTHYLIEINSLPSDADEDTDN